MLRQSALIAVVFLAPQSSLAGALEEAKLLPSDGAAEDIFGISVAVSGDGALIGADGAAYLFRFDGTTWSEEAKLLPSDGPVPSFGGSVGVSGQTAVIGASGAAYVFRFDGTTWSEEAKLLPSDGPVPSFGGFVAVSGQTAVIGASEAAYVFRFDGTTWSEEAKLLPSDGASLGFGSRVAVSGGTALIGADRDDDQGFQAGSAYVFRFDGTTWVEEAKLLASDALAGARFGAGVALDGDTALIGAPFDGVGSVYVFRFDGTSWTEETKLHASDGAGQDFFGRLAVGIFGDTAVIGAPGHDDSGTDSGAAYVFRFDGTTWIEEAKLLASDGVAFDFFGETVGLSGDTAVIGAAFDDDNGTDSGSAYVFRIAGPAAVPALAGHAAWLIALALLGLGFVAARRI